jgi:hypothetical protein
MRKSSCEEYFLIDSHGKVISDILQIKFSTDLLYMMSHIDYFHRYYDVVRANVEQNDKIMFTNNLKQVYRQNATNGSQISHLKSD